MSTKILVLENTEGISELLNISLAADYDVITVPNGEEALKIVDQSKPPLLICDINVPDMDGIEFLCKVKKQHPATEVIIIADNDNTELGVRSLKYEASDFLIKPVTSGSLEVVLERARKKLAIKKKLSPMSADIPDVTTGTSERISLLKQLLSRLNESQPSGRHTDNRTVSSVYAVHNRNCDIIDISLDFKSLFGDMTGKKSWEIYSGDSSTPDRCPVAIALETSRHHRQETGIKLLTGEEASAEVYAAPLLTSTDQVDLVLEVINI